jgi:hypothetical protein
MQVLVTEIYFLLLVFYYTLSSTFVAWVWGFISIFSTMSEKWLTLKHAFLLGKSSVRSYSPLSQQACFTFVFKKSMDTVASSCVFVVHLLIII